MNKNIVIRHESCYIPHCAVLSLEYCTIMFTCCWSLVTSLFRGFFIGGRYA